MHLPSRFRRPAVYKTAGENAQLLRSKALSEHGFPDYTRNDTMDPTLELIVEAWAVLPNHIKAAIDTLVNSVLRTKNT